MLFVLVLVPVLEPILPGSFVRPTAHTGTAALDIDRYDVYRLAVQFAALAARLRVSPAALRDQLDRASCSIALNLAEGLGRSGADRIHFFRIARGSALESAAVLDVVHARGGLSADAYGQGRSLLVRIVQMATRLIDGRSRSVRGR